MLGNFSFSAFKMGFFPDYYTSFLALFVWMETCWNQATFLHTNYWNSDSKRMRALKSCCVRAWVKVQKVSGINLKLIDCLPIIHWRLIDVRFCPHVNGLPSNLSHHATGNNTPTNDEANGLSRQAIWLGCLCVCAIKQN